jgi:DNA-binding beta-propeller fold protein YncE
MATADRVLWVHAAGRVVRIDPATNAVVGEPLRVSGFAEATIAVGEGPLWVASVAPGDLAGPCGDDRVIRIDPATGRRVAAITVRWAPLDIAATPGAVWVTNSGGGDSVTRIDPETNRVAGRPVVTGASPQSLAVGGGSRCGWSTMTPAQ